MTTMTAPTHNRINEKLEHYWQELRAGREMPMESEISIEALKDIWDHCFLVSVGDQRFAYSYMGEQLIEAYGDDYNGKEVAVTLLEPHPKSLFTSFQQVVATGQPLTDDHEFVNSNGVTVKYRACILPVGAKGYTGVAYLLGGMKWKAC